MKYQVQENAGLERIFEPELIQEELDVYNPLIPGRPQLEGRPSWSNTRTSRSASVALAKLVGIENCGLRSGRRFRARDADRQRGPAAGNRS